MPTNVFYDGLNEFCRKYLIEGETPSALDISRFSANHEKVFATVFENLLLFDKVSFKVFGENIPLVMLLNKLGERGLDQLIEQDAVNFILWTPMIVSLEKNIDGLDPIFAGIHNSEAHCDPEKSIELGLNWMQQKLDRSKRRALVRKLRDKYHLPNKNLPNEAVQLTNSAYLSGKLDGYGFNSKNHDIRKLPDSERRRLTTCATDLLEYNYLLSNQMSSFSKKEFFLFFSQTQQKLKTSDSSISGFCKLAKLEQFPDLQTLYSQLDTPFEKLLKVRGKSSSARFRAWLDRTTGDELDAVEITKAYVDAIADAKGFFQTIPGKLTKTAVMSSIGAGIGAAIGGLPGGVLGLSAAKFLEPAADVALDLVDQFVVDGLTKGWTPRIFMDDLRDLSSDAQKSISKP
jgi:hypothetical protein